MKPRESGLPFDDIRNLLESLPGENHEVAALTRKQSDDAGGRLADICCWYSAWSGRSPIINRPLIALFAGTHEVDPLATSRVIDEVTAVASGEAAVNRLCSDAGHGLKLLDLALQIPVGDISTEAALDEKSCTGTIGFGMEAIAGGTDLVCLAAVEAPVPVSVIVMLCVMLDLSPEQVLAGYGMTPDEITGPVELAIQRAIGFAGDPLELLRQSGGRETAAICGAILAARSEHVPVLIAGPSALASAILLAKSKPGAIDHCRLAEELLPGSLKQSVESIGLTGLISTGHHQSPSVQLAIAASLIKQATQSHGIVQA